MPKLFFEEDCKGYIYNSKYYVIYRDNKNVEISIEVEKEIFDTIEEFRKYEKKQRNIDYRNFSLIHINEYTSGNNNVPSTPSAEDTFFYLLETISNEQTFMQQKCLIKNTLSGCTHLQITRFIDHAYLNMTLTDISKKHGCTKQSIHESISQVYKKILKNVYKQP